MRIEDYTAENICQSLGLQGFESDPALLKSETAMRLLLKPSFHPELCVTITSVPAHNAISVVVARRMIWRQLEPVPMLTDRDHGEVSSECFSGLVEAFVEAANGNSGNGIAIDGMAVESVLFRSGVASKRIHENVGIHSRYKAFVSQAISVVWESLSNVYCKNALAETSRYVDTDLPLIPEPLRKPTVDTLLLGPEEDRKQLLEAIKKHNDG